MSARSFAPQQETVQPDPTTAGALKFGLQGIMIIMTPPLIKLDDLCLRSKGFEEKVQNPGLSDIEMTVFQRQLIRGRSRNVLTFVIGMYNAAAKPVRSAPALQWISAGYLARS